MTSLKRWKGMKKLRCKIGFHKWDFQKIHLGLMMGTYRQNYTCKLCGKTKVVVHYDRYDKKDK